MESERNDISQIKKIYINENSIFSRRNEPVAAAVRLFSFLSQLLLTRCLKTNCSFSLSLSRARAIPVAREKIILLQFSGIVFLCFIETSEREENEKNDCFPHISLSLSPLISF